MKLLIAPAKKMRVEEDFLPPKTQPALWERSAELLQVLQELSLPELRKVLACSDRLAQEAAENFQRMDLLQGSTPALLAYDGIQYKYMAPGLFTQPQWDYVEEHLRILSGFYGVLRPMDGVRPYRLEMQARLQTPYGRTLYEFWGETLGDTLLQEDQVRVNLASEEYAKAVRPAVQGRARFVRCVFAEEVAPGTLVEKGVYVKMARGEMVRFAAENALQRPEDLRQFDRLGYVFSPERSQGDVYVFCRSHRPGSRKL